MGLDTSKPNLLERRKNWNTITPDDVGLPTEIWRETITRLQRYFELKTKINKGQVQEINDLITYNLNIRKLIQDYLEQTQDAKFIRNFYKSLCEITILDPTCGSGAFLFAALNILQPLYEVCIQRMEEFYNANPKGNTDFEQRLSLIKSGDHPNISYYIFKTIILHNLYGVDIMKEAVEIAKLRLFLKLVAEVDPTRRKPNYGLEPLPDIDFNIRSGNTLVGFATEKQLEEVVKNTEGDLIYKEKLEELKSACKSAALSYEHFQKAQISMGINSEEYKDIKKSLSDSLKTLSEELNRYLAETYGLGAQTQWKSKKEKENAYQEWKNSHQPFHWLAEFYEIISKGGFDVVIGNPPYVEYSKVKGDYTINNYESIKSGNLYAFVIERCLTMMKIKSRIGMIIQLSAFCTPRMEDYQNVWFNKSSSSFVAFFDDRPGKLFDGLEHIRVAICISELGSKTNTTGTTNYIKFRSEFRPLLFNNLHYENSGNSRKESSLLKVNSIYEQSIINKLWASKNKLSHYLTENKNDNFVYYGYGYGYFGKILNYQSFFEGENVQRSTGDKFIYCGADYDRDIIVALMNSTLFYWFYINYSDGHNFTKFVIGSIPFDFPKNDIIKQLKEITNKLMVELQVNSNRKTASYKATGKVIYDEFYPKKSKPIIDEIDKVLAKHYGFTEEELDFIINYDIKYRMGGELGEGE